jgi:SAM-dependent methyltransferase
MMYKAVRGDLMDNQDPRQPDANWYDEFYIAAAKSGAYSEYCVKLFGYDFTQQGFSDTEQLGRMLDIINISPGESVLDIGCGNGKMIEYICDKTGAHGFGFDISKAAIGQAGERTKGKGLEFEQGDINTKRYPDESFDVILAADTAYFTKDLESASIRIWGWLKKGGRLAAFYSAFRFSDEDPQQMLTAQGTALARALSAAGISYSVIDLTRSHYEHMKKKRSIIAGMKARFEAEGTLMLYESAYRESVDPAMGFDEFSRFSTRYFYTAVKPK